MKRLLSFFLGLALLLLASIGVGRYLGLRAAERAVAPVIVAEAMQAPPKPASLARPSPDAGATRPIRSREELRQWLGQFQKTISRNEIRPGSLQFGFGFGEEAWRELASLHEDEFRVVRELVEEMPKNFQWAGLVSALGNFWMKQDLDAGWAYLQAINRPSNLPPGTEAIKLSLAFIAAADADPHFAARELVKLAKDEKTDPSSLGMGMQRVMEELARTDWKAAFDTVQALPASLRGEAMDSMKSVLDSPQREAYLATVREVKDDSLRHDWQASAAKIMAPEDSAGTAQWIDSLGLPERDREAMTREVFQSWKTSDPPAALKWARERLPESEHPGLLADMVQSWAQDEPNTCGRWLGEQETGPLTDPAREAFAKAIAEKDHASALAWAETISDPARREQCLADLAEKKK